MALERRSYRNGKIMEYILLARGYKGSIAQINGSRRRGGREM
jgi:hypothetical protein